MIFNTTQIIRNCQNVSGRFQEVEFNINARYVVALIQNGANRGMKGIQWDAKVLLRVME